MANVRRPLQVVLAIAALTLTRVPLAPAAAPPSSRFT
jgi:hypothetical protein